MNIDLSEKEIKILKESINNRMWTTFISSEFTDEEVNEVWSKLTLSENRNDNINENVQILDKVRYNKERGYVTGQIDNKLIVMVQGNTYLVDSKDLKEYNKKSELTTEPHMKFDEKTQKLLFEQYIKCGIYQGNTPIKLNDCFVKFNQWENANPEQQIKVIVEGNTVFMQKKQIRLLEDLNNFANEDNYIPGVLIDEETEEATEKILVNAIEYSQALGDADSVQIIKRGFDDTQEIQYAPKSKIRTLSV